MPDQSRVPSAHEVTLGEVHRLVMEIRQEQRDMRRDLIGRAEYESDQESVERRLHDLAEGLADERRNREAGDKGIVSEADKAKRWAITTAITGAVAVLTVVGFLLDLGGTPT